MKRCLINDSLNTLKMIYVLTVEDVNYVYMQIHKTWGY